MTSSGVSSGAVMEAAPRSAIVYCAYNEAVQDERCAYVGLTEKFLGQRKHKHFYSARNGSPTRFHRAIRKYGEGAFRWYILDIQPDYFKGLESEARFIKEFRKTHDLYNLTDGGGGVKGLKFSAAAKEKMAHAKRGKPNHWSNGQMPQAIRDHLAECRRAERGRPLSEKQKSASKINSKIANAARRKSVICINDGTLYESVTAAARAYDLTSGQVAMYCRGKFKSRIGLQFKYGDR